MFIVFANISLDLIVGRSFINGVYPVYFLRGVFGDILESFHSIKHKTFCARITKPLGTFFAVEAE